jgi:transposase
MRKEFDAGPVLAFEQPKFGKRRAFTTEQMRLILEDARQPGNSLSAVARKYGISPSLAFSWKRQMEEGTERALAAGEPVVPECEARILRAKERELERLLGRKTMEVEILRKGIEIARSKKWLPRGSSSNGDSGR